MNPKEPMRNIKSLIGIVYCAMLLSCAYADDWPQWQGPDRNAISKETGLLKEWPKDGPPLAWKTTALGGGDSAPSIAAGRIYGMANRGEDEIVWALSEADGKTVWVSRLGPAVSQRMSQGKEGPSCTPTVDGDRLYVEGLGGDDRLAANTDADRQDPGLPHKLACLSVLRHAVHVFARRVGVVFPVPEVRRAGDAKHRLMEVAELLGVVRLVVSIYEIRHPSGLTLTFDTSCPYPGRIPAFSGLDAQLR